MALYLYFKIFFTEYIKRSSVIIPLSKASLNFLMATGTFSANSKTSFPAKKASKSISPGFLKLLAPFIFNASVKIKPSKFNSFFNKSVTTAYEIEVG